MIVSKDLGSMHTETHVFMLSQRQKCKILYLMEQCHSFLMSRSVTLL